MSAIKTDEDLRDVSFALYNKLRVGIPAIEALKESAMMLPKFKVQLEAAASLILSSGVGFDRALANIFPADVVPALIAGERSGTMEQVLFQIYQTAKLQIAMNKLLKKLWTPFSLLVLSLIVSLGIFLFVIPVIYQIGAKVAPNNYDHGVVISAALAANATVMQNQELFAIGFLAVLIGAGMLLTRPSVKEYLADAVVRGMLSVKSLGSAYANLKFGMMAKYLQIVSLAGLDAQERIDLVMVTLPAPLRKGMVRFKAEMLSRGLSEAAQGNPDDSDDPRNNEVLWPAYVRLAFIQANDSGWAEPMGVYSEVMVDLGREKLELYLEVLNKIALLVLAASIAVPASLLFGSMGSMMSMAMGNL